MTGYILYMYQKYEMVYTLVYVYILINEISLTGLLFWNIIVHVIVNVQFMAERERENLDLKKNHIVIFPLHIYQWSFFWTCSMELANILPDEGI